MIRKTVSAKLKTFLSMQLTVLPKYPLVRGVRSGLFLCLCELDPILGGVTLQLNTADVDWLIKRTHA